jgi:hypothetical protein
MALIAIGDSLTEGLGDAGFVHAPGVGWPALLAADTGRAVINLGISSQSAPQIAGRLGCPQYQARFMAGALSGGVQALTLSSGPSPLLSLVTRSQAGSLGGIPGTLTRTAPGSPLADPSAGYTFTPSSGAAPTGQSLAWVPTPQVAATDTLLLCVGRNNITAPNHTIGALDVLIRRLGNPARYIVTGILLATDDSAALQAQVAATNTYLSGVFGARFLDPNTFGITPTDRADPLHPNRSGYIKWSTATKAKIQALGY